MAARYSAIGLLELTLAPQGVAQVVVGLGVVGLEPDRGAESIRRSNQHRGGLMCPAPGL